MACFVMSVFLRARAEISCYLGLEAPVWQGARSGTYREYVTDEQRRQAGCIDVQNGKLFLRGPLGLLECPLHYTF